MSPAPAKRVFTAAADDAGRSLEAFVADRLEIDRGDAAARIRAGAVYLDRRRERDPAARLVAGQRVRVYELDRSSGARAPTSIYRDGEVVVLDKPAGLASMPGRGGGDSVADFVRQLGRQARLLHRLDRESSGLLLVSVRAATRKVLATQIERHEVERSYIAVVEGALPAPLAAGQTLEIASRLAVERGTARSSADARARPALTRARLIRRDATGRRALLHLELRTGRMHQIRVHLAEQGIPIVGDARYGGVAAPRLALHATSLAFTHPDGRYLRFHSPGPDALRLPRGPSGDRSV